MSFVSRETANASKIYNEMLKDKDCTIFLTLAGSTSAAGCMHIYRDMVKYNMVDAIVATGASNNRYGIFLKRLDLTLPRITIYKMNNELRD